MTMKNLEWLISYIKQANNDYHLSNTEIDRLIKLNQQLQQELKTYINHHKTY